MSGKRSLYDEDGIDGPFEQGMRKPLDVEDSRQLVELTGWQHRITYTAINPTYGRAEFQFCPVWKRGRIVECWIYPRQQQRDERWHVVCNADSLVFSGTPIDPKLWHIGWCKDHKTATYSVYVPNDTDTMSISCLSSLMILFSVERAEQ